MNIRKRLNEELTKHEINQIVETFSDDTIIVCIGTDRSIGDAVGPYVGTLLKELNSKFPVYGTLDNPIHGLNIHENMKQIQSKHPNANIIAIDACIPTGSNGKMGDFVYSDSPIYPGAGVGKNLLEIGNHSVKIIIGDYVEGKTPITYLNSMRLSECMSISTNIANTLYNLQLCSNNKKSLFEKLRLR